MKLNVTLKRFGAAFLGLALCASIAAIAVQKASAKEDNKAELKLAANAAINAKIKENGMQPQITIGANGKVLVRGAKITAISGTTINAQVLWGSYASNWTVNASGASFLRHYGGASAVSEMSVGDIISFSGMLDTTAANATVKAEVVKDWSVDRNDVPHLGTLQGDLKVIGGTTAPTTLTVNVKGGNANTDYTVNVAANTAILNKDWGSIGLGNLAVGDNVRFYGLINGNVSNATVVRDLNK